MEKLNHYDELMWEIDEIVEAANSKRKACGGKMCHGDICKIAEMANAIENLGEARAALKELHEEACGMGGGHKPMSAHKPGGMA